ncbi:MAG TPA: DUF423 domain-containing protein [Acetobacteraceae bacterium]|nr:DUF423 domain-containing protein [Acetobacteraceae bacterium]
MMARVCVVCGALAGCGAVAAAAVAAHALPGRLDARALAAVRSAIDMQAWHALALLFVGLWMARLTGAALTAAGLAGAAFVAGVVLFCGSVYALELAGVRVGPTAPAGGILLMVGWLLLAASAVLARGG